MVERERVHDVSLCQVGGRSDVTERLPMTSPVALESPCLVLLQLGDEFEVKATDAECVLVSTRPLASLSVTMTIADHIYKEYFIVKICLNTLR